MDGRQVAGVEMQPVTIRTRELRAVGVDTRDGIDGVLGEVGAETDRCHERARRVVGSVAPEAALDPPAVGGRVLRKCLHGRSQAGPAGGDAALDCGLEAGRKTIEGERRARRDADPPQPTDHRLVFGRGGFDPMSCARRARNTPAPILPT